MTDQNLNAPVLPQDNIPKPQDQGSGVPNQTPGMANDPLQQGTDGNPPVGQPPQQTPPVQDEGGPKAVPSISDMARPVSPPIEDTGTGGTLPQQAPAQEPVQDLGPAKPMGVDEGSEQPAGTGVQTPPTQPTNIGGSIPPGGMQPSTPNVPNLNTSGQMPTQQQPQTPAPVPDPGAAASASEELKKTHEPVVDLPDRLEMGQVVNVKVKVGMIPHVMEDEHNIQSIELYANDQLVGKSELQPGEGVVPEAEFQVALVAGLQLKAIAYCNIHGKWEGTRTVGGETI